jgi:hypothetical protein
VTLNDWEQTGQTEPKKIIKYLKNYFCLAEKVKFSFTSAETVTAQCLPQNDKIKLWLRFP